MPRSISINSPTMEPSTSASKGMSAFSVLIAAATPSEIVIRPMPEITMVFMRSGKCLPSSSPSVPPTMTAAKLMSVPIMRESSSRFALPEHMPGWNMRKALSLAAPPSLAALQARIPGPRLKRSGRACPCIISGAGRDWLASCPRYDILCCGGRPRCWHGRGGQPGECTMSQPSSRPKLSLVHLVRPPQTEVAGKPPLLIQLHGIGSNEYDLFEFADLLDPRFVVLSARAPLVLGLGSFAWFHVDYLPQGYAIKTEELRASQE